MSLNLKEETIKGSIWMMGASTAGQIIQLFITAVIARLLEPRDYGIFGMAFVLIAFLQLFSELGVGSAIIQKKNLTDEHLSSIFWLNIAVGGVLALIYAASAPFLSWFFHSPSLRKIAYVLSFNFVISALGSVQFTLLTREMRFKKRALINLYGIIGSGLIGIILAYNKFGMWSLVWATVANNIITTALFWVSVSWKPRFVFYWSKVKELIYFGLNVLGFNIVNYFSRNIQDVLIGRFLNPAAFGYYSMANRIMLLPVQYITWRVSAVLFPALSHAQDELETVKRAYVKSAFFISIITFPVMMGLIIVAREAVLVLLGAKWEPVILLIQILSVASILQSIISISGSIILSRGRADLQLKLGVYSAVIICVAIFAGLRRGIVGIAIFYTASWVILSPVFLFFVLRLIKLEIGRFLRGLLPATASSLIMVASVVFIRHICISMWGFSPQAVLIGAISVGITTYIVVLRILFPRDFHEIEDIFIMIRTKFTSILA